MSKIEEMIAKLCPNGVEYKTLGEVGTFERGRRFVKADAVEVGTPCIHYGELYTHYGISATEVKFNVSPLSLSSISALKACSIRRCLEEADSTLSTDCTRGSNLTPWNNEALQIFLKSAPSSFSTTTLIVWVVLK